MLQGVLSLEWSYPWTTFPSEVLLLHHRHTHGHQCFGVSCFHMDTYTGHIHSKQKQPLMRTRLIYSNRAQKPCGFTFSFSLASRAALARLSSQQILLLIPGPPRRQCLLLTTAPSAGFLPSARDSAACTSPIKANPLCAIPASPRTPPPWCPLHLQLSSP